MEFEIYKTDDGQQVCYLQTAAAHNQFMSVPVAHTATDISIYVPIQLLYEHVDSLTHKYNSDFIYTQSIRPCHIKSHCTESKIKCFSIFFTHKSEKFGR